MFRKAKQKDKIRLSSLTTYKEPERPGFTSYAANMTYVFILNPSGQWKAI